MVQVKGFLESEVFRKIEKDLRERDNKGQALS